MLGGLATAGLCAGAGAFGFLRNRKPQSIPGSMEGANIKLGHIARDGGVPAVSSESKTGIVIVGGGVAGLCAGWELKRRGYGDFILLEMERSAGGNCISGRNGVSAYPWGAHYVPLPGPEAVFTRELFEELGVITGYDGSGLPIYNEYHLCSFPQERLLLNGQWQEGLIPNYGASKEDIGEFDSFFSAMDEFKRARGADGKRAFVIPVDESSRDERFLRYDDISMVKYMEDNGWKSKRLLWHVDYCCRDDYGDGMGEISAWAGIHYFAARNGEAANAEASSVLTWPEGNGWITSKLVERFKNAVRTNAVATNVEHGSSGAVV
ncbi:MAG: NAD(P)/FAD-dependent oxidoreductase, partial [Nitrospinae bacterium]|nr:NAD(P)/FAD-dependent oxidoreductase [Nitrospinota bacterium]